MLAALPAVSKANDTELNYGGTPRPMNGTGTVSMKSEFVKIVVGEEAAGLVRESSRSVRNDDSDGLSGVFLRLCVKGGRTDDRQDCQRPTHTGEEARIQILIPLEDLTQLARGECD